MRQPDVACELSCDLSAIQAALECRTRDALLRRLGPTTVDAPPDQTMPRRSAAPSPSSPSPSDPTERQTARGIAFGLDLVRAILDGRKTQTRRLIRPRPIEPPLATNCPIARAGALLCVREPWLRVAEAGETPQIVYAADESPATGRRFRPAMYMPRDAARIWLRVTSVRAERITTITPDDLAAEGLRAGQSLAAVWDGFYTGPGERYADDPWVWAIMFAVEK